MEKYNYFLGDYRCTKVRGLWYVLRDFERLGRSWKTLETFHELGDALAYMENAAEAQP